MSFPQVPVRIVAARPSLHPPLFTMYKTSYALHQASMCSQTNKNLDFFIRFNSI